MTEREYNEIDLAMDKAEESVVPFPVMDNGDLSVVGDANETQRNAHDFKIKFRIPRKEGENIKYYINEVDYKDVFITPRMDAKIVKAMITLLPYFRKVNMDGGVEKLSNEERETLFDSLDDEFFDAIYGVVAAVLRIDKDLVELMTPDSALKAAAQIIVAYPEMVNEADTFFG